MPKNFSQSTKTALAVVVLAVTSLSSQSVADDMSYVTLSANAALTTEYRFRGLSLSNHDPAIQGGFDLSTKSGFYLGAWGSSIESYEGSEVELDIYGGYATEIGNGLTADVGLLAYTYPGSDGTAYLELYGSLSGAIDIVDWTVGAAYVWDQGNVGNTDNIYIYLDASMPLGDTPVSLDGHLAYEDGAFGDDKWDWSLGASYSFEQYSLSVAYVDTNVEDSIGKAAVVATLSASF